MSSPYMHMYMERLHYLIHSLNKVNDNLRKPVYKISKGLASLWSLWSHIFRLCCAQVQKVIILARSMHSVSLGTLTLVEGEQFIL